MLNHWNELKPGVLIKFEKKNKPGIWEWALYMKDGKAFPIVRVNCQNVELYAAVDSTLWPEDFWDLNKDADRVRAYNYNKCNAPMKTFEIQWVWDDSDRDSKYMILDYLPEKEYTIEELEAMLGRTIKVVGGENA